MQRHSFASTGRAGRCWPLLMLLVAACGDDKLPTQNETVEQVLQAFGVGIDSTPRVDDDGDELPGGYGPLGSRCTINRFAEVMLFGVQLGGSLPSTGRMALTNLVPGANNSYSWEILHDQALESAPWFEASSWRAASGDFDGDGLDEVAIAYQVEGEPMRLVLMEDAEQDFAVSEPKVIDTGSWKQVFLISGDFDGDSRVDLVAAFSADQQGATLRLLANDGSGGLQPSGDPLVIEANKPGAAAHVALAVGNIDYDSAQELALVLNESDSSRYRIYDDATTGFAELKGGITTIAHDEGSDTAVVGQISLGDVDGDGVDEVVLGGSDVRGTLFGDNGPQYLLEVFDDAKRDFAHLAGNRVSSQLNSLKPQSSGANQQFRYLHVLTADIDGDGAKEIISNQFIYQSLRSSPAALVPYEGDDGPIAIPLKDLFADGSSGDDYYFDWTSSDMAVADVTSDKRQNIVIYVQRLSVHGERQQLQVWGLDQVDGWKQISNVETTFDNPLNTRGYRAQILLPDAELDNESMALAYSQGSHRFVFTEPVVLAALAAAPCSNKLDQDLGESCRTAFGQAVNETSERTDGWSIIAGVSVGYDGTVPFVGGPEALLETQNTLRMFETKAYTLTKRVLRETGANEDSVIFSTVPLDIYSYTVLSHPNPELVGEKVEVRMPREPLLIMTQREVYNANVEAGALRIDDAIYQHKEGDPSSYPSAADKTALLRRFDGLESDQVDVGQGGGQTVVSITSFESTTTGKSYEFEATLNLKATAGAVVGGFKVGGGADVALSVQRGSETIYQGSVGNIGSDFFPAESYSWGLFSYIYEHPAGQTFEVLNYWVE